MKALAYNHLGEIVYEDAEGTRFAGRSSKALASEPAQPSGARFLRADAPEERWLCALAMSLQPERRLVPVDDFFKIISRHVQPAQRPALLEAFVVDALHAFYRSRAFLIDSARCDLESLAQARQLFDQLRFPKALERLSALSTLAPPEAVVALRAAAQAKALPPLQIQAPFFDPFDGALTMSSAAADSPLPWSISNQARLREPLPVAPVGAVGTNEVQARAQSDGSWTVSWPAGAYRCALDQALEALREARSTEIGLSGRHPYAPLTSCGPAVASMTTGLSVAHAELAAQIHREGLPWDDGVAEFLGMDHAQMGERLSAEQIDACGLAARSFASRKAFILADETGLGKGRTLAALARAFLRSGRRVTFITEKRHLFSDFWRDLGDVYGAEAPPEPFLLHPKGRVLSPQGDVVAKTPSAAKYKRQLAELKATSLLLLTTYSQFNRDAKHADKHSLALAHAKDGLLILDESHSASGESRTRENILSLVEACSKCVFSSATYAKHEQAFELYASATPLGRNEMSLLLSSFAGADPLAASNALAQGLVRLGGMARREHAPDENQASRLTLPDSSKSEEIGALRDKLHHALDALFGLQEALDLAKWRQGEETEPSWLKLGGALARVCRQFNLLSKVELACDLAASLLAEGKKPVIALESTFEAFMRAQIAWSSGAQVSPGLWEAEEAQDAEDDCSVGSAAPDLSFRALFKLIVESAAPDEDVAKLRDQRLVLAKSQAQHAAEQLPDWLASPLDLLRSNLEARGFSVGEISGRSMRVNIAPDGSTTLQARSADEREATVRQFNDGSLDALLITQAGASGISLHAAAQFKDRRPRAFIELEICANPSQRVQFLGRVRRKGQVVAPEYHVVSSGSPYEHRLIERATGKQRLLSGLTSATQELAAGALSIGSQMLSPRGDKVAMEWLRGHPQAAKKLGVDPARPVGKDSLDTPAERLLKRLPLLPAQQQDDVFSFMAAALSIDEKIPLPGLEGRAFLDRPVLARCAPIWGPAAAMESGQGPAAFEPNVYIQEWACLPPVGNLGSIAVEQRVAAATERLELGKSVQRLAVAASRMLSQPALALEIKARMRDLGGAAAHLAPGARLRMSHPDTRRPLEGMILDIEPPEREGWTLYPSQWRIRAGFPGQPFELSLSLASFLDDPHAHLDNGAPVPAKVWDDHPPRPHHFATIDGHCGYSRWYAAQFGAPGAARFVDSQGRARELNCFPFDATIERAREWKIPLIDPRLALQLLQRDTMLALDDSATDAKPTCRLAPTPGGWFLAMERSRHDAIVDFALDRRLGPRKSAVEDGQAWLVRFVSARDIHSVIPMLHLRGCRFFAPASRAKWHATALELLLATAKPAKKGAKRR
jgi:hypothetical protein